MLDGTDRRLKNNWRLMNENKKMDSDDPCWDSHEMVGTKNKDGKEVPNCVPKEEDEHVLDEEYEYGNSEEITLEGDVCGLLEDIVTEAEYQGRKVKLNKPMRGDVKKFKVYVKNPKGNVVKVNFGDKNMRIKKSDPKRRKSFRARHNCDNPGPKHKARYWSCRKWEESVQLDEKRYDDEDGFNSAAICHASLSGEAEDSAKFNRCQKGVRRSYMQKPEDRNKFRRTRRKAHDKIKTKEKVEEDLVPGGYADEKSLMDIAKSHNVDLDKILDEFSKGIKVEFEHTNDENIAAEIAKDHLMEIPDYYTRLEKMENNATSKKELKEDEDPEFVITHDEEDSAKEIINAYEDDDEITPREAIEEISEDLQNDKSQLAKLKSKFNPQIENWNTAWVNINRSGKGGKAATSSVGSSKMPFSTFNEALDIYYMNDDEKDEKLLDIIGFVGSAYSINRSAEHRREKGLREGQERRQTPDTQYDKGENSLSNDKNVHTGKGLTISPFQRDDILRASIFGRSEDKGMKSLNIVTNSLNKNNSVDYKWIFQVGKYMDGPVGKFLQFLLLDGPANDSLSRQFLEILKLRKQAFRLEKMIKARKKAIDYFEKVDNMKVEVDPLNEGFRNWKLFKKKRYC